MIEDGRRLFLRDLRMAQGGAASCGALRAARPATQEPDTVLAGETKPLAVGGDTRESIKGGALHAGLL
jgi:hypothetical protein